MNKIIDKKPKLLILQNNLVEYRMPVFNALSDYYNLTVGYRDNDESVSNKRFESIRIETRKIGHLFFCKRGFYSFIKQFDIILFLTDLHNVNFCLLPITNRAIATVGWSIGFSCSYNKPFDVNRKHTLVDKFYYSVFSLCDSVLFYMKKSYEFWKRTNLNKDKVFFANNTTAVLPIKAEDKNRKDFLFVGSLYKEKGISVLIESFSSVIKRFPNDTTLLHIIGDGAEKNEIERMIHERNLDNRVILHGAIYDENELSEYFSKSLLCISPYQAGLSVPKSMGYGVTFVTRKDAITGGELYHITNGVNGILYEHDSSLPALLEDAIMNKDKYIQIGNNACDYYNNNATIEIMVRNIQDALEYALKHKHSRA